MIESLRCGCVLLREDPVFFDLCDFCANDVLLKLIFEANDGVEELNVVADDARAGASALAPFLRRVNCRYDPHPVAEVAQAGRAEARDVVELFPKLLKYL